MKPQQKYFEQQSLIEPPKKGSSATWRWGLRKSKIILCLLLVGTILMANSALNQRARQSTSFTKDQYSKILKMVKLQLIQIQIKKFKAAGIHPADLFKDSSQATVSDRKTHAKSINLEIILKRRKTRRFGRRTGDLRTRSTSFELATHTPANQKLFDIKGANLYFSFIPVHQPPKSDWIVFGFSVVDLLGLRNIPLPVIFKKGTRLGLNLATPGVNDQEYTVDKKELLPSFVIPPEQAEKLPVTEYSGAEVALALLDGTESESKISVNLKRDAFKVDFIGEKEEKNYIDVYIMQLQDGKITNVENLPEGWRWSVQDLWAREGGDGDLRIRQILKDLGKGNAGSGNPNFDQLNWEDVEKLLTGMM